MVSRKLRPLWIASLLAFATFPAGAQLNLQHLPVDRIVPARVCSDLQTSQKTEVARILKHVAQVKGGVVAPEVPTVNTLSICPIAPAAGWDEVLPLSDGFSDPYLERARELKLIDDFKILSDMRRKPGSEQRIREHDERVRRGGDERRELQSLLDEAYTSNEEWVMNPEWFPVSYRLNHPDANTRGAFDYAEKTWPLLLKRPKPKAGSSLLSTPYPVLVPAGRFQESYYWDSYFGILGLLATGRLHVAQMQVENFLSYVQRYGFVPNGGRDYYLTRSQPPFLSTMVRETYEASLKGATGSRRAHLVKWLRERAFPLLKKDYLDFWMNPKTRYDEASGLNHHWDEGNTPRPERHGADNELALGVSYRDTRAAAESGLDFTEAHLRVATRIAGPLLNSMLYKTEMDLAWIAEQLGPEFEAEARKFKAAANRRKAAIQAHLWNPKAGRYDFYHLDARETVDVLSAETVVPLFVGLATPVQAARVLKALAGLEKAGGLMTTNRLQSPHQWDGANGWAPFQVMAIAGLKKYGYNEDARRIAKKWVGSIARGFAEGGGIYERMDVIRQSKPHLDPGKYPVQEGFLWTNGSLVWALVEVLGYTFEPVKP